MKGFRHKNKRKFHTLSEEHKRKIGLSHKGMKRSTETKLNIRASLIGRKLSEESKMKMRLAKLGKKHTEQHKKNMSLSMMGIPKPPRTKEHTEKIRLSKVGKPHILTQKGLESFIQKTSGSNNCRWIEDRSKIKIGDRSLNDPLQKGWRKAVKNRDGWKCRIADENCSGKLEAHHILPWSQFPELRYQVNNGITLCHAHHPRKKEDVAKLSPYFQQLVASSD